MGAGAIAAGIGAAATIGNTIASSGSDSSAADAAGQQAADFRQQAADQFRNLPLPALSTTPYGMLPTPEQLQLQNYDPITASFTQTSDDPAALAAMRSALGQLQDFSKGGLQPADRVALQDIGNSQNAAGMQAYKATLADLMARGQGGAGANEAARLSADQGAANSSANLYDQAMQTALQRQLSAINSAGTLAGNIRQGTDNINTQMANAANAFNTNIAAIRTSAAQNAAANANSAATFNLQNKQNVTNQNVTTANQNLDRANQIAQENFGNQTTNAAGTANALNNQATAASANQAADSKQALGDQQNGMANLGLLSSAIQAAPKIGAGVNYLGTAVGNLFGSGGAGGSGGSGLSQTAMDGLTQQAANNVNSGFFG